MDAMAAPTNGADSEDGTSTVSSMEMIPVVDEANNHIMPAVDYKGQPDHFAKPHVRLPVRRVIPPEELERSKIGQSGTREGQALQKAPRHDMSGAKVRTISPPVSPEQILPPQQAEVTIVV